ncbi:MAG: hypothetical protein QNJ46_23835 [Leptolyngbyaceae cyanobacterium MO_188.B28]|nr:hypothetical protein [Leptolyngbyaceae cyanobacterium MO_188.B28]
MHGRSKFYEMLGLDAAEFDADVIRHTHETAARASFCVGCGSSRVLPTDAEML